jgi:hypothetical protein
VSDAYEPVRSYQRLFRPERRLYAIEGRALPVPGGVPLRWLGWAAGALVGATALASGSPLVLGSIAATAALGGRSVGGRGAGIAAATMALAAAWLAGVALARVDWPLRLIVLPIALATLATQATPDGRRAERFAASWLALRLAPARRSAGRALPLSDRPHHLGGKLWVAPDERSPVLVGGRVRGPATVSFADPVCLRRAGSRGRRLMARPIRGRSRRGSLVAVRVAVAEGEVLEVRA